ncbi:Hypothetical_protein [Hexamita inflata]|uniref:Hypothetical_protein n=1 Tax=Hexamita inflata TaxID=28002 RepID=A0AA86QEW1_9EUKA|nr:Hypothetical protein HINF_LOCUS42627 [Hexamita inflata]
MEYTQLITELLSKSQMQEPDSIFAQALSIYLKASVSFKRGKPIIDEDTILQTIVKMLDMCSLRTKQLDQKTQHQMQITREELQNQYSFIESELNERVKQNKLLIQENAFLKEETLRNETNDENGYNENQIKQMQETINELNTKQSEAERKSQIQKEDLIKMEQEIEQNKIEIQKLQNTLENSKLGESEHVKQLMQQIQLFEQQVKESERMSEEKNQEIENLKNQIEIVTSENTKIEVLNSQVTELNQQIQQLQEQIKEKENQIEQQVADTNTKEEEHNKLITDVKESLQAQTSKYESLHNDIIESFKHVGFEPASQDVAQSLKQFEEFVTFLKTENQQREENLKTLQQEIQERSERETQQTSSIENLGAEMDQLKSQIQTQTELLDKQITETNQTNEELAALALEKQSCLQELENLKTQFEASKLGETEQVQQLTNQISELKENVESISNKLEAVTQEREAKAATIVELEAALVQLKGSLEQSSQEHQAQLREVTEKTTVEKEALKQQLLKTEEQLQQLQEVQVQLQEQLQLEQNKCSQLSSEIDSVKSEKESISAQIAQVSSQCEQLKQHMQQLNHDKLATEKQFGDQLQQLEAKSKQADNALQNHMGKYETVKADKRSLEQLQKQNQEQITKLQLQLQELNASKLQMEDEYKKQLELLVFQNQELTKQYLDIYLNRTK